MNEATQPPMHKGRTIPAHAREELWRAPDGQLIRRIDWAQPDVARGALLFAPGRGDCYEKYLEALSEWHAEGWHVTSIDWRGQGMSGRLGADDVTGHIDDFENWIADLAAFWAAWRESVTGPCILVGHSMGGHNALRAVAEGRIRPDALVLVAPMLGLNPGWVPSWILHGAARLVAKLGDRRRPAWKARELPLSLASARMKLLTHDEARYADETWWYEQRPGLLMGPPSWGWVVAAIASIRRLERRGVLEALSTPVLILGATADSLVSWAAIRRAAARLPRAELLAFGPEARHEILREATEVRDRALQAIRDFLERVVPRTGDE
ncbi:alpha/beta fold hydrolase [Novosphingobium sp. M1R2S20]|uniref:Alpha/beta fold hydrolase n=1 Tax=Novosphingobium rhizovicinum TaxID=3228928 RepID=A0ABV3R7W2_9SPHN